MSQPGGADPAPGRPGTADLATARPGTADLATARPGDGIFELALRASALALAAAALVTLSGWGLVLVATYAGAALVRLPRRRLAVELALVGVTAAAWGGLPLAVAAAAALATLALAPESGTFVLNGLDRFFVAQEYPGCPCNSHHFVDTREPWDRAALERAAGELLRRVPVARTFVRESLLGVERFVARAPWLEGSALVTWLESPVEVRPEALDTRFDLGRQPPWRLLHAPRPEGGFRLVFTGHHSAFDGAGGMLFLDRILRAYAAALAGKTPDLPEDPPPRRYRELLAPRGWRWLVSMVRRHVRPMDKVGVQNASLLDDDAPRATTSRHELAAIPQDRWESLRSVSAARGLSRNDLLVTAALRAAVSWRAARGKPERAFRVLFPVDLRAALGLPVCYQNFVGVIRSDFSAADAAREPDALARLVSERVREGRTLEEAIETPTNLGFLSAVLPPWAFRSALRTFDADPRSFFFSFLWSNIRVPELPAPPGLTIERVWIRGSLTRQPGFGLVVTADGRQVNVALEYLVPLASAEGVRDYRDRFLAELAALAA